MLRDGWRCQACGARLNLEVHHKQHRSQSGDDSEQNLVTLCASCHVNVHREHAVLEHYNRSCCLAVVTALPQSRSTISCASLEQGCALNVLRQSAIAEILIAAP